MPTVRLDPVAVRPPPAPWPDPVEVRLPVAPPPGRVEAELPRPEAPPPPAARADRPAPAPFVPEPFKIDPRPAAAPGESLARTQGPVRPATARTSTR